MRHTLLATAAIFGLALAAPLAAQHAFAQSAPTPDSSAPTPDAGTAPTPDSSSSAPAASGQDSGTAAPAATKKPRHHHRMSSTASSGDEKFAHEPGTGESGPASMKASNIDSSDSHSEIAPHLPSPKAGHDATADAYLGAAQRALRAHHTGEAQQALEMAETRLLDRSTPAGSAGTPASDPQVMQINEARKALGQGDMKGAHRAIQMALGTTGAGGGAGTSSGAGSTSGAPSNGAMNSTTDTTTTSTGSSMSSGAMSGGSMGAPGATSANSAPTGAPGMAPSGAGAAPGASAGASVGGGPLGSGTADSAGGAK